MTQAVTDILVARCLVSMDQVAAAQVTADSRGDSVLRVLVQQGAVSKKDIVRATVQAAGFEFVEILDVPVEPSALSCISGDQARRYGVVPLRLESDGTVVMVADSQTAADWQVREDLQAITGRPIVFTCAVKAEIASRINREYRAEAELGALMQEVLDDQAIDILAPVAASSDAPLVRYVNLLLAQAISDNASDVHVEPSENSIRIRFRIDGVLKEMAPAPKEIQAAIISRIKIMSDMNIAERRVPQDGRLSVQHAGQKVDLRVSSIPTVWGEKIVMRILDNSTAMRNLGDLGFSGDNLVKWRDAYTKPYGLLVVSGPTGSGKSTTLYATLHGVSNPEINIVTVEDPVEYRIPGINQVQVNVKAGLTFGAALRSILRADPDVILIGEIRDKETAQIAVESALTGHLVLTTLHTNDSASVVTRLTEMGMEPYLVSSALTCASGQRLARRLCEKCKTPATKTRGELELVGFDVPSAIERNFFDPVGCPACAHTGFSGRVGLHEVMPVGEALASLALRNASASEIQAQAVLEGMRTLRQDGWLKVAQGLTTVPEVLRVVA